MGPERLRIWPSRDDGSPGSGGLRPAPGPRVPCSRWCAIWTSVRSCRRCVPTLLVHRVDDTLMRVEHSRYMADGSPTRSSSSCRRGPSVVVRRPGRDRRRGGVPHRARSAPGPDRVLDVMFTDIVASTERAAELGDRRARAARTHEAVVHRELERHRGREVKTMGDGFLATFDGRAGDRLRPRDRRRRTPARDRGSRRPAHRRVRGDERRRGRDRRPHGRTVVRRGRARRGAGLEHGQGPRRRLRDRVRGPRHPSSRECRASGGSTPSPRERLAPDPVRAVLDLAVRGGLDPATAKAALEHRVRRVEGRVRAPARRHDHVAAGAQHARRSPRRTAACWLRDGRTNRPRRAATASATLNATLPSGSSPIFCCAERIISSEMSPRTLARGLTREQQRPRRRFRCRRRGSSRARAQRLRRRAGKVIRRPRPGALVPARRARSEEALHRPAQERPQPGCPYHMS